MVISKAEFKDIPEIVAIQKLAFYDVAKFYNNFKLGPLQVTINDLENSFCSYIYFILTISENIVGSVRVKINQDICKVENMIVHPDFQNKGIGKKLILNLEREFPACSVFELFTGKDSPKNVTFYQKMGYEIVDEIPATKTEPVLVIMKKSRNIT